MSKTFEEQLKALQSHDQLNPDHVWVSSTREQLRMQMRSPEQSKKASWFDYVAVVQLLAPQAVFRGARTVAMFVLVVAVALGGWGVSVSAAQKSLPGDLLYVVKLAHEKQQVRRAETDKDRVEILLKQASTRVDELEQLQDKQDAKELSPEKKKKHTETVLASLKEKIETTNETLEKARQEKDGETIAVAKVVEEETERLGEQLRESIDAVAATESDVAAEPEGDETDEAVEDVAELVEEANVKAVVVTVETILEGDESVIAGEDVEDVLDEAKEKVTKKIENLEKTLEEIQEDADEVSDAVDVVEDDDASAPVSTTDTTTLPTEIIVNDSATTETTATGTDAQGDMVEVEEAAVEDVKESVEAVEKEIQEVKELVEEENLREAIEKVEALYTLKNDVKDKVQEVKKQKTEEVAADSSGEASEAVENDDEEQIAAAEDAAQNQTDQESNVTVGTE